MKRSFVVGVAVALASCQVVHASYHLWHIHEIYSNADGSVQFVELFTDSAGEHQLHGHTLTSGANTLTFTNSAVPTVNQYLLLATANFGAIAGGVSPDYIIPSNFFNPLGDTLDFAQGTDVNTFALPSFDGVASLNYSSASSSGTMAMNTPRNNVGVGGSVNLSTELILAGDYNADGNVDSADYTVWRDALGRTGANLAADGNRDLVVDALDYTVWRNNFGNSASDFLVESSIVAIVPEPPRVVFVCLILCALLGWYHQSSSARFAWRRMPF